MARLAAAVALALALALPVVYALAAEPATGPVFRSITIYVPAVSGEGEGDILEVTVTLKYPGRGLVGVESGGPVGSSTIYSMRMAVIVASLASGVDWRTIDVNVTFNTYSAIEGPSASFAVASVVAGLLEPFTVPAALEKYAITGAVSPDGLNSRVGGVPEKCRAADVRGVILAYPPSNEVEARACSSAVPVAGLASALELFFNVTGAAGSFPYYSPEPYRAVMRGKALDMAEKAEAIAGSLGSNAPEGLIARISELTSLARELAGDKPYSAASLAFTAYSRALMANASIHGASREAAEQLIEWARAQLEELRSSMPTSASTWPALELLSVAYTRLANAEASLYRAGVYLDQGAYRNASAEAAFTIARIESIKAWVEAAEALNSTGPRITGAQAKAMALIASEYAGVAVNYSISLLDLIGEETGNEAVRSAMELVRSLYRSGKSMLDQGNYIGAIGYFREALSEASYRIFYYGLAAGATERGIEAYRVELEALLNKTASMAAARGVFSVLAASYLEYSRVLWETGDPMSSIRLLESAVAASMMSLTTVVQAPSYLLYLAGAEPDMLGGPPPEAGVEVPDILGRLVGVVTAGVAVAFMAGYLAGVAAKFRRVEDAVTRL